MNTGDATTQTPMSRRHLLRVGLLLLGFSQGATGLWALASPHGWWQSFPGLGRHWIRPLGPYNDELVRDFGAMYVALAAVLIWSGLVLERRSVQGALLAQLVFVVLHGYFVSFKLKLLPNADKVGLMVGIVLTGLLAVSLLVATRTKK
jgi:hypothetical protein